MRTDEEEGELPPHKQDWGRKEGVDSGVLNGGGDGGVGRDAVEEEVLPEGWSGSGSFPRVRQYAPNRTLPKRKKIAIVRGYPPDRTLPARKIAIFRRYVPDGTPPEQKIAVVGQYPLYRTFGTTMKRAMVGLGGGSGRSGQSGRWDSLNNHQDGYGGNQEGHGPSHIKKDDRRPSLQQSSHDGSSHDASGVQAPSDQAPAPTSLSLPSYNPFGHPEPPDRVREAFWKGARRPYEGIEGGNRVGGVWTEEELNAKAKDILELRGCPEWGIVFWTEVYQHITLQGEYLFTPGGDIPKRTRFLLRYPRLFPEVHARLEGEASGTINGSYTRYGDWIYSWQKKHYLRLLYGELSKEENIIHFGVEPEKIKAFVMDMAVEEAVCDLTFDTPRPYRGWGGSFEPSGTNDKRRSNKEQLNHGRNQFVRRRRREYAHLDQKGINVTDDFMIFMYGEDWKELKKGKGKAVQAEEEEGEGTYEFGRFRVGSGGVGGREREEGE
ncbi:hypothetical protein HDV00_002674, partial [Rhizophlyctis rosea]